MRLFLIILFISISIISYGQITVTLDGSLSTICNYDKIQWRQYSGQTTSTLKNADSLVCVASGLIAGVYRYELTITDITGKYVASKDSVNITVLGSNPLPVDIINLSCVNHVFTFTTQNESNLKEYDIEETTDGVNYIITQVLKPKGNSKYQTIIQ